MTEAQQLFRKHFAHPPTHLVKSPCGVELLGTGKFIADGLTISVAVDRGVAVASAPRQDGRIEVVTSDTGNSVKFWVDELDAERGSDTIEVFNSVLRELRRRGAHFTGFSAALVTGTRGWPHLNQQAAIEAAVALTVRCLQPYTLSETGVTTPPRPDMAGRVPPPKGPELTCIALACRAAAVQRGVENPNLEDRLTVLHGKEWNLVGLDSQSGAVELIPFPGNALVLCRLENSNSDVLSLDAIPQSCLDTISKLGVKSLRSLETGVLQKKSCALSEQEFNCAKYVLTELQRVVFAERALRNDDHRQFGQYLIESHRSACDLQLQKSGQLSLLVDLARRTDGCLGSRVLPGQATIVNLVAHHSVPAFTESLKQQFAAQTGVGIETCVCHPANGAGRIEFR